MAGPLRAVLKHQMFATFTSSTASWRDQAKVRPVFADILHALTGVLHNTSNKKCIVASLAHRCGLHVPVFPHFGAISQSPSHLGSWTRPSGTST